MEAGGGRRRRLLADEKIDSPNLRDFLRVKQDGQSNSSSPSVTLGAVLSQKRPPPPATEAAAALVHRTLLDIIRDDPIGSSACSRLGDWTTWRNFKDKLRAGVAWSSSAPTPASDVSIAGRRSADLNTYSSQPSSATGEDVIRGELSSTSSLRAMMTRHTSSQMLPASTSTYGRVSEERESEERESEESDDGGEPQARMSLMALLAETDRQMGLGESTFVMDDDNDEDEEEGVRLGVDEYNCCVCMVRLKGAALIPCGHTFCRLCSRELWVQRGNCPLCNNFILEILDIF